MNTLTSAQLAALGVEELRKLRRWLWWGDAMDVAWRGLLFFSR
jgi:hypothetical protein